MNRFRSNSGQLFKKYRVNQSGTEIGIDWEIQDFDDLARKSKILFDTLDDKYNKYLDSYFKILDLIQGEGSQFNDSDDIVNTAIRQIQDDNGILDQLEQVLDNEFTGKKDNLIKNLKTSFSGNSYLIQSLDDYIKNYDNFFKAFNKVVDFTEETQTNFRQETLLHQFVLKSGNDTLKEIFLDENTMSALRKDKNIFKLKVEAAKNKTGNYILDAQTGRYKYNINLSTRYGLAEKTLTSAFEKAGKKGIYKSNTYNLNDTSNYYGSLWNKFLNAGLLDQAGQTLGLGRINEAFYAALFSGVPEDMLRDFQLYGYNTDNLPWYHGGDQTFSINGQRINMSQKSFDFSKSDTTTYGIDITSWDSLQRLGQWYQNPKAIAEKVTQYYQDAQEISAIWGDDMESVVSNLIQREENITPVENGLTDIMSDITQQAVALGLEVVSS